MLCIIDVPQSQSDDWPRRTKTKPTGTMTNSLDNINWAGHGRTSNPFSLEFLLPRRQVIRSRPELQLHTYPFIVRPVLRRFSAAGDQCTPRQRGRGDARPENTQCGDGKSPADWNWPPPLNGAWKMINKNRDG